ncbi:MAG TPA: cyclohexa-1,5-dienecarbonyl-CoA hydratase [Woeseiaceae bacterium]|nr:cyclohexa-1,5-dienecarbonyl-CoA hydratase [Woeseiaceae bacterium]
MTDRPLKSGLESDGQLLRLRLARPKANLFDAVMIEAVDGALSGEAGNKRLKAVLLCADGPHFSFGASVEEHLPGQCESMLRALHGLILRIFEYPVPVLGAVRGQCLGGGLEVAAAGHLMFAAPDAKFGQPEIKLGVFAPAASCLLPIRIGRAKAEDMLFSGRSLDAPEAHRVGLVNAIDDDPESCALAWFERHLLPLSAGSLRFAVTAARGGLQGEVRRRLAEVETLYLEELMSTRDAVEGLNAFIAGREPQWGRG